MSDVLKDTEGKVQDIIKDGRTWLQESDEVLNVRTLKEFRGFPSGKPVTAGTGGQVSHRPGLHRHSSSPLFILDLFLVIPSFFPH